MYETLPFRGHLMSKLVNSLHRGFFKKFKSIRERDSLAVFAVQQVCFSCNVKRRGVNVAVVGQSIKA